MNALILMAYFVIVSDVTGGSYAENILGPFTTKMQCEEARRSILDSANSPNSPIRISMSNCRSHETINKTSNNWSLLGPLIARREAMGTIQYDVFNRPNNPTPVTLPRNAVQFSGEAYSKTQIQCSDTGCRVLVNGVVTKICGDY